VVNYLCIEKPGIVSYPYCRPWDKDTRGYTKETKTGEITGRMESVVDKEIEADADIAFYKTMM
jgi:hypothetical protein